MEAARLFIPPDIDHPHLVLCGVDSEQHLLAAADRLFLHDVRHTIFREPDRGGEATALATEPIRGARRKLFERYRCLTREDFLTAPGPDADERAAPGRSTSAG